MVTEAGTNRLRDSLAPIASLVAVAVLVSPIRPFPLLAVPFALLLVAFRPREMFGLATAAVLLALVFRPGPLGTDSGWFMQRGWCLLTGGLFVGLTVLRRPRGLFDPRPKPLFMDSLKVQKLEIKINFTNGLSH